MYVCMYKQYYILKLNFIISLLLLVPVPVQVHLEMCFFSQFCPGFKNKIGTPKYSNQKYLELPVVLCLESEVLHVSFILVFAYYSNSNHAKNSSHNISLGFLAFASAKMALFDKYKNQKIM